MARRDQNRRTMNDATVGYEQQLWQMAVKLRGSMDAAEYKHVVLGLIFLKYISDAFDEQHARLEAEQRWDSERLRDDTRRRYAVPRARDAGASERPRIGAAR